MENNKLICPFCQQEYIITKDDSCFGQQRCICRNPNCEFDGWHFPVKLVSELDRTKKQLEIAVDALKEYADRDNWGFGFAPWIDDGFNDALYTEDGYKTAQQALEQLTALEQKDE